MTTITLMDGDPAHDLARSTGTAGDAATVPLRPYSLLDALMTDQGRLRAVHDAYIDAGTDIVTMATASLTPTRLYDLGLESRLDDLLATACGIACSARKEAPRDVLVAACLGPLIADRRRFEGPISTLIGVYEYLLHMMASDADLILCAGMASAREAEAAVLAGAMTGRPVWLSFAVDQSRPATLAGGETLIEAVSAVDGLPVEVILLQYEGGDRPATMPAHLAPLTDKRFGFRVGRDGKGPEGFLPESPVPIDTFGYWTEDWLDAGATVIGGGSGVQPAHTAHARSLIDLRPGSS